MKDRILGLPRNVFYLGLTSFFNDFSSEMVASVFPAFFISVLKTGAESIGPGGKYRGCLIQSYKNLLRSLVR